MSTTYHKVNEALGYIAIAAVVIFAVWFAIFVFLSWMNATVAADYCQAKNGDTYDKSQGTGKRWEINPLTIGTTGRCVDGSEV